MTFPIRTRHTVAMLTLLTITAALYAQSTGLTRTLVGKGAVSIPGREAVIARVEVAPGAHSGRHTHPGDEISYLLEGEAELLIDGQAPRTIKAGESFVVPAGVVHDAYNKSNGTVRLVGVYIVEKNQPLASPAVEQKLSALTDKPDHLRAP